MGYNTIGYAACGTAAQCEGLRSLLQDRCADRKCGNPWPAIRSYLDSRARLLGRGLGVGQTPRDDCDSCDPRDPPECRSRRCVSVQRPLRHQAQQYLAIALRFAASVAEADRFRWVANL